MYLGTICGPQLSTSPWTRIGAWSHTSTHSYLRHLLAVSPQRLYRLEGAAARTEYETGHAGGEKPLISPPAVDPSAVGYANLQGWDVKALLGSKVWSANCCKQTFLHNLFPKVKGWRTVSVAARSKAWVCGHSPVDIVGSNPTGGAWMSVCCECCVLLDRADHSSREAQLTVVRSCVWSRNLVNEEALANC